MLAGIHLKKNWFVLEGVLNLIMMAGLLQS